MTTEETAKEYFEHRFRALDGETQREEKLMCGIAYRVLRQKTENNAPLTLDELREMDFEPVWISFMLGGDGEYRILYSFDSGIYAGFVYFTDRSAEPIEEYGKSWLAYRRKPKEAQ